MQSCNLSIVQLALAVGEQRGTERVCSGGSMDEGDIRLWLRRKTKEHKVDERW